MDAGVKLDMDIDAAVELSLREEAEFQANSGSTVEHPPRVLVRDGGDPVARRPFKLRGHWCVRWTGTARLVEAFRLENGVIVFRVTWNW